MLSKAFEIYRIVDPQPTSDTIDKRKAAVGDMITAIEDAEDWTPLLQFVVGVADGFDEHFQQDSSVIQILVDAIKTHESAFPGDLSENALELRACAAMALGEIMTQEDTNPLPPDSLLIASALRAGIGIRPSPEGIYLKQLSQGLDISAAQVLANGGIARRQRKDHMIQNLVDLTVPDDPATATTSINALKTSLVDFARQSEIDLEEINVLWWMFSGRSETIGELLSKVPAEVAILCCGTELGNQCLLPPTPSVEAMVQKACETGRKQEEMSEKSLQEIAGTWGEDVLKVLVPDEASLSLVLEFPVLFPLSWLCNRLLTSHGMADWRDEFKRSTGLSSSLHQTLPIWGIQVFRERITQRIHAEAMQ